MKTVHQEILRIKEIMEGVGDKYAEKQFNIPNEIDSTPEPTSDTDVIVVRRGDNNPIIKNPSDPKSIGNYTRGVIDKDGNLYLEKSFYDVHNQIISYLINANLIDYKFDYNWPITDPEKLGFITAQYIHGVIYVGNSHKDLLRTTIGMSSFQKFMDKAKAKNPNFNFVPKFFNPNLNQ